MKIAVIGSGIAGIAIAYRLSAKGHHVTVFEKNAGPGGKMSEIRVKNYRFDTGPSLFTLPELVDELFELTNEKPDEDFRYHKLDILCKYFYEDSVPFVAYAEKEAFKNECYQIMGEKPEHIEKHFRRIADLYALTADIFLFNSLHKIRNYLKLSVLKSLMRSYKLKFYKTMHRENMRSFRNVKLVQLFDRYATYNGSNPYRAPATLNIIGHLEHNKGAFFPEKGMYSIIESLCSVAERKGVQFVFNTQVSEIIIDNNVATGLKTGDKIMDFDRVISDVDVNYLAESMMKHPLAKRLKRMEPSSSALIFYWGMRHQFPQMEMHNLFFSRNYREEFQKLFVDRTPYEDPTLYVFISSKMVPEDAPKGCENWFVMINVPSYIGEEWIDRIPEIKAGIIGKINRILKTDLEQYIEFEKISTPHAIEENTMSRGGALYGTSSNSLFSAFLRHPNFLHGIKNLYFTGGSVHPGGGIPLCLASAKIVDQEIPYCV